MPASCIKQREGGPTPPHPTHFLLESMQNGHWLNGCDAGSHHALGLCVINQNRVESISWAIGFALGKMCALLTSVM